MENHKVEYLSPQVIKHRGRPWLTIPKGQVEAARKLLRRMGMVEPLLINADNEIVCGSHFLSAAREERLNQVPVIRIEHLSREELRLYAIAANRIAAQAGYDDLLLADEIRELEAMLGAEDIKLIGMAQAEVDRILGLNAKIDGIDEFGEADKQGEPISKEGDVWVMDDHRLLHGDALMASSYALLMHDDRAAFGLSDVPYNLPANAISGNGKHQHQDFVQAAGEMSPNEFTRFLTRAMRLMAEYSRDGSLHAFFMSYHFLLELLRAGNMVFGRPKVICTWVKSQGGMGSLFRSRTEFVTYFKHGTAQHTNNIQLGAHGLNRTTAWEYPGMNSFSSERDELLAIHPTPKPVELLKDAILDVTERGDIVLDPFAGSGSIILAAHVADRRAYAIEIEGKYVDATLRRVSAKLGIDPRRERDGALLSDLASVGE